jgi:hypothetical protein
MLCEVHLLIGDFGLLANFTIALLKRRLQCEFGEALLSMINTIIGRQVQHTRVMKNCFGAFGQLLSIIEMYFFKNTHYLFLSVSARILEEHILNI